LERFFKVSGTNEDVALLLRHQSKIVTIKINDETVVHSFFEVLPDQVQIDSPPSSEDVGRYWLQKSDCFTCHEWSENTVGPGFQQIAQEYTVDDEVIGRLIQKVREGGSGIWGDAVMNPHPDLSEQDAKSMVQYILSLKTSSSTETAGTSSESSKQDRPTEKPGFGAPLEGVHPSYDVVTIHPEGLNFPVGGMAFLPDGRLVIATWSPDGSVYILDGVETGDQRQVKAKRIASGLAEVLGVEVVDNEIFVLQKHELTQLIDLDGDEVADEYRAICNGFGVSADFHEFAFGLAYKDNHFYLNLSLPMRLMENEKPLPDRGKTIKVARNGSFEWVNHGLRQPNGIGLGVDQELFITDNQGQWLPANKLIHVRFGDFHGMRWGLPDSLADLEMAPPAVWLPEDEIANSPSEPSIVKSGPYEGQMIFGDVSHGGIKRVTLEKINGSYQGAVFRFTQGLEAGVSRMRWGPDGALYIGEVGMVGGWSWRGGRHGLQRMIYNGKVTFEMLDVKATPTGFEIGFTEPLGADQGNTANDYEIQQWWYLSTERYGGPKKDLEVLEIRAVNVSEDRTRVFLEIPELKSGHVVYFRLGDELRSSSGQNLWSSESWYTLNYIPGK